MRLRLDHPVLLKGGQHLGRVRGVILDCQLFRCTHIVVGVHGTPIRDILLPALKIEGWYHRFLATLLDEHDVDRFPLFTRKPVVSMLDFDAPPGEHPLPFSAACLDADTRIWTRDVAPGRVRDFRIRVYKGALPDVLSIGYSRGVIFDSLHEISVASIRSITDSHVKAHGHPLLID